MQATELVHARIAIPVDCLPLVADLVGRLGGIVLNGEGEAASVLTMPEIERRGARLKALRQREGMTQKTLADAVGVPQTLSNFEKTGELCLTNTHKS
jgi:hypothetical protein